MHLSLRSGNGKGGLTGTIPRFFEQLSNVASTVSKAVISYYIGRSHKCKLSVQIGTANPAEARVMAERGGYTSAQESI